MEENHRIFRAEQKVRNLYCLLGKYCYGKRTSRIAAWRAMGASVFLVLLVRAERAAAQGAPPISSSARLEIDNDLIALRGRGPPQDFDYTHGTRITVVRPIAPVWIARALGTLQNCADSAPATSECLLSGIAFGQEIYTPRHNVRDPVAGDRPHAAWLYGAAHLQRLTAMGLQVIELRIGVTGRPALGEQVQNGVHRLLHNHLEAGWEHQLPTRFGTTANYDATRLLGGPSTLARSGFVAGTVGATFGTLRRSLRSGVSAYYGFGQVSRRSADAPLVVRPRRFALIAGYRQSLVLYDAFIEGVGPTRGAERLAWVGEAYSAVTWRFSRFAAEYRYVLQGREYRGEPGRHAYGSIALSVIGR